MLRHVEIAEGIQHVGFAAWQGCQQLQIVKLPSSVLSLEDGAFQGCYALREVVVPGCVQFSRRVFTECCSLSRIGVNQAANDDNVLAPGAQLGRYAFESCLTLTSTTFVMDQTNKARALPERAFCGSGLETLCLPSDLPSGSESWDLFQSNSTVKKNQLTHTQLADSGPNSAAVTLSMEPAESSGASAPPEREPVMECCLVLTTLSEVTINVSLSIAKFDRFADLEDHVVDCLISVTDLKVFGCAIEFLHLATQTFWRTRFGTDCNRVRNTASFSRIAVNSCPRRNF